MARVQPGSQWGDLEVGISSKQELGDDLLHPGGTGLGIGRDDNIVVSKRELVPDR
jgi:hypothetical protein